MNPDIKAILFDIGGTIRFTERVKGRDQKILEEMRNFLNTKESVFDLQKKLASGYTTYQRWCQKSLVELSEEEAWTRFMLPDYPAEFIRENAVLLNQYWRRSVGPKKLFPDAIDTIKELSRRSYRLSIVSNTTSSVDVPAMLKENDIAAYFSTIILSAVYGRRKPHPSVFLDAARQTGVHPGECAYVGNCPSRDLIGAREAGYAEVVIIKADQVEQEESSDMLMKPDFYIRNISELLKIFPDCTTAKQTTFINPQPEYLFDAALSTMWGVGQDLPFKETFYIGRKIGFPRFELNHAITPELFAEIDFNQFRAGSVHDPCPATINMNVLKEKDWMISSRDEECRKKGVEVAFRTIDLAVKLGANSVIIHPGQINGDRSMDHQLREMYDKGLKSTPEYESLRVVIIADRARKAAPYVDSAIHSLQEIIEYCRFTELSLGLENRYRYYDIPIIDEMALFLDLCKEPWYGFQYDVGHAYTLDQLGYCSHQEWLERYGSRIVGVHLHDVIGIIDHQAPGLGDVDFNMVAKYLPKYAYRTLEIGAQASQQEITAGMDVLVETGCVQKI
jgi:HAD superfamily hydrolase (TIGR01549 family)